MTTTSKHLLHQRRGIQHQIACPHTHEKMGVVERRHRQIEKMELALLAHSNMPLKYWEDALLTSTYIINLLPTKILHQKSPFEMVHNRKPDYNFFVFLVVFVGQIYDRIIVIKSIFDPKHASFLDTVLVIWDTKVLT